jgi:hypothetical protein
LVKKSESANEIKNKKLKKPLNQRTFLIFIPFGNGDFYFFPWITEKIPSKNMRKN